MKLPEYDNRPSGTPLYSDSSNKGEWDDIKFPALIIGLIVFMLVSVGVTIHGFVQLLKWLFN